MKRIITISALVALSACNATQSGVTKPPKVVVTPVVVAPPPAVEVVIPEPPVDLGPAIAAAQAEVRTASSPAGLPAWIEPLPADVSLETVLDSNRTFSRSRSVGSVSTGSIGNPVKLEKDGEHHEIIQRHRKRGTNYAVQALVDVIIDGARAVHETHGGAKLQVGNLSRSGGGDIPWSRSHNSGRDADLAFYVVDESGASVPLPDLTAFDPSGVPPKYPNLRFDVARNWSLVETMVTHDVGIQWLFISQPLKDMLLEHARQSGVDSEIVARAASVLHQPTDALPHDDHFHLRISCPIDDRVEGCVPSGPQWAWLPDPRRKLLAREKTLFDAIIDDQQAATALATLEAIRAPHRADIALWLIASGTQPDLHDDAMRIARGLYSWSPFALDSLHKILRETTHPFLDDALYIGRRALDDATYGVLLEIAERTDVEPEVRAKYVAALIHNTDPAIAARVSLLLDDDYAVAAQAHRALQYMTNQTGGFTDWPRKGSPEMLAAWQGLFEQTQDRQSWINAGFAQQGVENTNDIDALVVHLTNAPTHGAYHANRRLRELTGRWSPLEFKDASKVQERWQKWIDRNRERLSAEPRS